ncbi:hypothetical protein BT67DRAFT_266460 [Trichocladium antarcticum]|uniref:Uncharacterized protein n=1 Tax=Trichocladium antarcticum TaxID=1450529 RepID=A0AAN6UNH0_9PEZI|nr:hypothetical protein BT67DRAFT_266460 [Trichocladium antarcticum]
MQDAVPSLDDLEDYHKAPPYSGKTFLGMVLANQTDLRNEGRFSQYRTVTRAISTAYGHFP